MSNSIVFNVDKNTAKKISLPFELRVWYNEDYHSSTTSDNSGEHTVDVFVTLISEGNFILRYVKIQMKNIRAIVT